MVDDPDDDVSEVELRIDVAEFARLDQRGDDRPMLAAAIGAGEQRILPVQGDGLMLRSTTLESISIGLVDKPGEAFPAGERVADRLG